MNSLLSLIFSILGLVLGMVSALLMWYLPPRVTLYTEKGEPIVQWIGNQTKDGQHKGKIQKFWSKIAPLLLAIAFLLQLIATMLGGNMSGLLDFTKEYIYTLLNIAFVLQLGGTIVLTLFSFYGIKIKDNKKAILENIQEVKIDPTWLRWAQGALFALILGIILSWLISVASIQ